jgi:hypothetical protein
MKNVAILILALIMVVIVWSFVSSRSYYSHDNPILNQVRDNFSRLNPDYSKIPLREGNSAYTENKKMITLCLKDPETNKYYDINTIMYVALHELAHVVSVTHGHNEEFKKNFSILLREAARKGIYDPRIEVPQTYCGVGPGD